MFIASAKQIIEGYVKIIRKFYKSFIIGFAFAILISADAVLVHIQVKSKLQLRYIPFFSQFFEPKFHFYLLFFLFFEISLDIIIPFWYNLNIPFWDIAVKGVAL